MLSEFIQSVITRLEGVDAPVFQSDCVPIGTAAPYITLAVAAPLGESAGALTLTVWHSANAGRIALAEEIAALLSDGGTCLSLPSGHALITGGTASFLHEAPLLGLRMVWKLRFCPAG